MVLESLMLLIVARPGVLHGMTAVGQDSSLLKLGLPRHEASMHPETEPTPHCLCNCGCRICLTAAGAILTSHSEEAQRTAVAFEHCVNPLITSSS
mmetsp:Transcript_88656/g.176249  ORF Transcript_88656/g.176249 Transcript_88656/m.176249 type:complete len:95 (-) Transcript_88656:602-886(-)